MLTRFERSARPILFLAAPAFAACGGLVTWVDPGSSQGGASSSSASTLPSTSSGPLPDCTDVDAFDCESEPGCVTACLSTMSEGCFATCRPLTSVACIKTCTETSPFCPTGFIPEGDGTCYTGYCIKATVCLD